MAEAHRSRRELDERTRARLEEILSPEQRERVPGLSRRPRLPYVEF